MPERFRIFTVTGEEVVRFTLAGAHAYDVETVLAVAGPRSVAIDPRDPNRVYVGTFDDGLYATDDGGEYSPRRSACLVACSRTGASSPSTSRCSNRTGI